MAWVYILECSDGTFYTGSFVCFLIGMAGARLLFGRSMEDAVADPSP